MSAMTEFSATGLSPGELQAVADRIKRLRQRATEHAVEIGRELLRVKASLPHGVFVKWVVSACEFKIRTAQDLMKLAKAADANAQLVALMMPSTLRVFLSKTTPPSVRYSILARLENGERVSRSDVQAAVCGERARRREPVRTAGPDLLAAEGSSSGLDGDRSRKVAELLLQRLSPQDYRYIMDGMTWGVWNRVFVWMRAAQQNV